MENKTELPLNPYYKDKAEQYIEDYTRKCSNELSAVAYTDGRKIIKYHEWLTPDNARAAVEIAKEEMIEKACEWLENNYSGYIASITDGLELSFGIEELVEDFKKAMEE